MSKRYMLYDYLADVWVKDKTEKVSYTMKKKEAMRFKTKKDAENFVKDLAVMGANMKIVETVE